MKYCAKCGYKLPDTAKFCTQCGYVFAGSNSTYASFQAPSEAGEYLLSDVDAESVNDDKEDNGSSVIPSPGKSILHLLRAFFTGTVKQFTTPKNLLAVLAIIVIWILINMLRKNTTIPLAVPTLFTYAQGGTDRSNIFGIIGGILGKGAVLAFFLSTRSR